MNYSEKWGKDVDEAVELALADLKLTREEVDIEVLEEPSKGFLGIGSQPAKVRVSKKGTEKESSEEKKAQDDEIIGYGVKDLRSKSSKNTETRSQGKRQNSREKPNNRHSRQKHTYNEADLIETKEIASIIANRPEDLKELEEDHTALSFLEETAEKMGLDLKVSGEGNASTLYLNFEGEDAGTIIGKRGQTLDAIQYLTSLVVNRDSEEYIRVVVDAENYRAKREKTLQELAVRLGNKVIKTGRRVRLEPMNPYERMVIHATLHGHDAITTRSEGEEPYRRVIIDKN
jgi:spoIIIJ-associated protein